VPSSMPKTMVPAEPTNEPRRYCKVEAMVMVPPSGRLIPPTPGVSV
jgi:hypothetical protein